MKNFLQRGDALQLPAPAAIVSGEATLIGSIFGVATVSAASGETIAFNVTGVYKLPKAGTQAWAVGAKVYWDAAAKVCTTVATGNTLIGAAVEAVAGGAGDTSGKVRLNGTV